MNEYNGQILPIPVKIKKLHENAVIPKYAKLGDYGMDLTAVEVEYDEKLDCYVYHTGLAMEIPRGYVGLIYPRSSNRKTDAYMTNHVGVIDSGYRGELLVCFKNRDSIAILKTIDSLGAAMGNTTNPVISNLVEIGRREFDKTTKDNPYQIGERIAQIAIVPYPEIIFQEVDELSDSERGTGGHGSTGA